MCSFLLLFNYNTIYLNYLLFIIFALFIIYLNTIL